MTFFGCVFDMHNAKLAALDIKTRENIPLHCVCGTHLTLSCSLTRLQLEVSGLMHEQEDGKEKNSFQVGKRAIEKVC